MARFEKDFLLGAAIAAHQVEGNNTNSDNWVREQMAHRRTELPPLTTAAALPLSIRRPRAWLTAQPKACR